MFKYFTFVKKNYGCMVTALGLGQVIRTSRVRDLANDFVLFFLSTLILKNR